jgi:hypothetical protein
MEIMRTKENLTTLCGLSGEETELNFSSQRLGAGDAVLITNDIKDNGAMTSLNLASNYLRADGAKIIADAIKVTKCTPAIILVPFSCHSQSTAVVWYYPQDMGAMTKFDISSNDIRAEGGKALAEALKGNQVIKELNFSHNNLGYNTNGDTDTSGIITIADVIPGMGALTKLDISNNNIEQGEALHRIADLCNTKGVELDKHKSKSESESDGDD